MTKILKEGRALDSGVRCHGTCTLLGRCHRPGMGNRSSCVQGVTGLSLYILSEKMIGIRLLNKILAGDGP